MDCQGSYNEKRVPFDTENGLQAYRCDGCGEWMIVINSRGYEAPAEATLEQAVRHAFTERMSL